MQMFLSSFSHYGRAIRMFGPPMSYWTARFESKHRNAKSTALSSKNVVNITKTISERQQMRASSVFYNGMFSFVHYVLPDDVMLKSQVTNVELKSFMGENDFLVREGISNGSNVILKAPQNPFFL
jgi:hypothetical protein